MYSSPSPFSKTSLDINKLYVSSTYSNKLSDEQEAKSDKADDSGPSKGGELREHFKSH